jgi:hypothetical protein
VIFLAIYDIFHRSTRQSSQKCEIKKEEIFSPPSLLCKEAGTQLFRLSTETLSGAGFVKQKRGKEVSSFIKQKLASFSAFFCLTNPALLSLFIGKVCAAGAPPDSLLAVLIFAVFISQDGRTVQSARKENKNAISTIRPRAFVGLI